MECDPKNGARKLWGALCRIHFRRKETSHAISKTIANNRVSVDRWMSAVIGTADRVGSWTDADTAKQSGAAVRTVATDY